MSSLVVRNLQEYLEIIIDLEREMQTRSHNEGLWYRGIVDATLDIRPGLFWRNFKSEYELAADFVTLAPQYTELRFQPKFQWEFEIPWEWYFLMQHYGVPTPLTDWTVSPLVALYFAVRNAGKIGSAISTTPCVWVLDPHKLNSTTVNDPTVVVPGREFSQYWLYKQNADEKKRCDIGKPITFKYAGQPYNNEFPIAIYPIRANPRIIAQHGVFTVHGAKDTGIDKILGCSTAEPDKFDTGLAQIEIKPDLAAALLNDLKLVKLHELALFPELPKLASYLLELHQPT